MEYNAPVADASAPQLSHCMPPASAVWLLSRVHPTFRRRNPAARRALATRPWRHVADRWFETERSEWYRRNASMEACDPAALDDGGLVDHLADWVEEGLRALDVFERRGMTVMTDARFDAAKVSVEKGGICLMVGPDGKEPAELRAELMLVATAAGATVAVGPPGEEPPTGLGRLCVHRAKGKVGPGTVDARKGQNGEVPLACNSVENLLTASPGRPERPTHRTEALPQVAREPH